VEKTKEMRERRRVRQRTWGQEPATRQGLNDQRHTHGKKKAFEKSAEMNTQENIT